METKSVLIVDDAEMNIFITEGLLEPYGVKTDSADSGLKALEKIKNGAVYDIILMDHMMPDMDGIEATKNIRALGYTGTIIAITANNNAESGFDDFISKPVDVNKFNEVISRYIGKTHPESANNYKHDAKLIQIFCRDAEKAVATLRETLKTDNLKLYITVVHSMKSALANIGEHDASAEAFRLEKAGLSGMSGAESFIKTLESLLEKLRPREEADNDEFISEDKAFLKEQLEIIRTACESYDDDTAYKALDKLKEKVWKKATLKALEEIRDMLFLHSDFEGAEHKAQPANFDI